MAATSEEAESKCVEDVFPEAWYMSSGEDQKAENRMEPNAPCSKEAMAQMGIQYWYIDPSQYTYPVKSVPWDPKDALDPRLQAIRDERGYSYADIITVHPEHLPDFDKKVCPRVVEFT
jgi:1,2-dihydroxy-3-keto-5-methylthiopentene dioxygenase